MIRNKTTQFKNAKWYHYTQIKKAKIKNKKQNLTISRVGEETKQLEFSIVCENAKGTATLDMSLGIS